MNAKKLVRSINMAEGEVLTLEKASDRMEFEALPVIVIEASCGCNGNKCSCDSTNCSLHWM